jgi:hypothetical protein
MNKAKLKKLIQIPLAFHHQDIHDRLDKIEASLKEIQVLLMAIAVKQNSSD